jgi:hypothetical protein
MKTTKYIFSLLLANWLAFQPAFAAFTEVEKGQVFAQNLLDNPGFENGKAKWTPNDTADFSIDTSTPLIGNASALWDADAASDTLTSTAVAIPPGMYGRNMVVSCLFVTASGTATHEIQAYDGSNILAEATITSSTTPTRTSVNFVAPSSGSISARIFANADEPETEIDSCVVGPAEGYNVSNVSQATFVGGMENAGASTCSYSEGTSTGMTDFDDLGTSASCAAWTVTSNGPGTISAQGTNDHRLVYTNMPPGNYRFELGGLFYRGATGTCQYRLSDGTTNYQSHYDSDSTSAGGVSNFSFHVSVTTAGTRTYKLQAADDHVSTCVWYNYANFPIYWKIYRFPTTQETAYTADVANWRVDANLSGSTNFALGSSNQTSYIGMTNSGITLTNNTTATATAQVPCATTTAPSGTTCTAADESNGVAFTIPRAGTYEACVEFAHQAAGSGAPVVAAAFQIVETPTNAQTISQEGKSRVSSGIGTASNLFFPHNLCSTFKFDSVGQKVLRLMYEQSITATVATNEIIADGNTSLGQRDIHWTVKPIDQSFPAPNLVNNVVSPSSGVERIVRARISGAGAVTLESGDWINGSCVMSGTGSALATCTLIAGTFSDTPVCTATPVACASETGGCAVNAYIASSSTSTLAIRGVQNSNANYEAVTYNVICIGPK